MENIELNQSLEYEFENTGQLFNLFSNNDKISILKDDNSVIEKFMNNKLSL